MKNLVGTHDCKVDSKGRVMLPASLYTQIYEKNFVIKRSVFNHCLELYPVSEWDHMMNQVNKLNRFVKKNNDFIRSYLSGLRSLKLDDSGRFLIPKDLVVFASINKDVVLTASVNMVEIWNKQEYEKTVKETLVDFASLAEEVMGNKSTNEDVS